MLSAVFASSTALASDWRLVSIDGIESSGDAVIQIGDDGSLSGSTGCNRFTGKGTYADKALTIDQPLATTRMACVETAIDAQEQRLLSLFQGLVSVAYDPHLVRLTLSANDHVALLHPEGHEGVEELPAVFKADKVVVTSLSGLLNFRAEPTTSSQVIARLQAQSMHTNLGCERRDDRDWCKLSLENGLVGWASADYLDALTLGSRAQAGSFDMIGRLPCSASDGGNAGRCEYGASVEGNRTLLAVFTDAGVPVVLWFQGGVYDPLSSLGPFFSTESSSEKTGDGIRVVIGSYRFDVPMNVVQP